MNTIVKYSSRETAPKCDSCGRTATDSSDLQSVTCTFMLPDGPESESMEACRTCRGAIQRIDSIPPITEAERRADEAAMLRYARGIRREERNR